MKVLVLGATGFIGRPVALSLSRAGHEVYGLTRSAEKGKQLQAEEIIPIVAEPSEFDKWSGYIDTLDAVVDCVGGGEIATLAVSTFQNVEAIAKKRNETNTSKLVYIWTSGTWVHGDDRITQKTEGDDFRNAIKLTAWRKDVEKTIVESKHVTGIVIRASLLYGTSGSLFAMWLKQAKESNGTKLTFKGKPGGIFSTVHQEDLATCFTLAVEKAPLIAGLVLDASSYNEPTDYILLRILQVASGSPDIGYEAITYEKPTNPFEEALQTSTILRPSLARSLLGWTPRKPSMTEGIESYWKTYLATL